MALYSLVICVMEGSKWPDSEDYEAIDTLKMLIAIKMKESLNALDSVEAFVRQGYLTVFMVKHFVCNFNLQLYVLTPRDNV